MFGRITYKKLLGCRCVTTHIKKNSVYAQRGADQRIFDRTCFVCMFISHFVCVVPKLIIISFHFFITDINPCMEAWKIYIDPIWVLWLVSDECRIPEDVAINRVFK